MCVTHTAPIPQLSGLKARITRVTRETSIKKYGRKREIVSKVNRCNWPDSSIDEKRYTGKMEISALHPRNRNKIPTEGGGSRSNQYQSIKRFIPDRFPFRLFPQQFSIYLRHRNVCPPQNLLLLLLFYLILLSSTLFPRLSPLSSRSPSNHPLIRPKTRPSTAGQVLPRQKGSGDSRPRAYHRPCEPCESLGSPISSSLAGCNIEKSRH